MLNEKRILAEFFELVQIRCSTRNERQIADLLTKRLEELGCTVTEDNAGEKIGGNTGNLVANLKGTVDAPTVMLTAHMDCVEPCEGIKPVIKDGLICSDGTTILGADDKAGVTAILETLRVLKEDNIPHGDIQVVFTCAEEGGVNGSKNMDRSLLKADLGYTLDTHGAPGKIVFMAPGQNKIFVRVEGKAAHAGIAPEKGNNAIVALAKMLTKIPQGRIDEETTCNVGTIKGGEATNIVAEFAEMLMETRSRNKAKLDKLTADCMKIFEEGGKETGTKVTVELRPAYNPFTIDKDSLTIKVAAVAAEKLGFEVRVEESGGGSDANFFNAYGIPTTVLSVGMNNGHTKQESIREKDLYDSARLALQIVKEVASAKIH